MQLLNVWWIYVMVIVVFLYVILQSFVFLRKAYKRGISLGMKKEDLRRTVTSSLVFSIAPSVAILIGLVTLSRIFGPMISGMRLGTLGAVTYELPAAINVIQGVFNKSIGDILSPEMIVTALWVMTFGCIPPLLIIPLFYKKLSKKMIEVKEKDRRWNDIMMDALFLGMISAFIGYVIAPKSVDGSDPFISVLSILVFLSSAVLIMIFGFIIKKWKAEWLKNYALPFAMVCSMALAIVYASLGVR